MCINHVVAPQNTTIIHTSAASETTRKTTPQQKSDIHDTGNPAIATPDVQMQLSCALATRVLCRRVKLPPGASVRKAQVSLWTEFARNRISSQLAI